MVRKKRLQQVVLVEKEGLVVVIVVVAAAGRILEDFPSWTTKEMTKGDEGAPPRTSAIKTTRRPRIGFWQVVAFLIPVACTQVFFVRPFQRRSPPTMHMPFISEHHEVEEVNGFPPPSYVIPVPFHSAWVSNFYRGKCK